MLHYTDKFKFYCQFPNVIFLTKRKLLYHEDFWEMKKSIANLAIKKKGKRGKAEETVGKKKIFPSRTFYEKPFWLSDVLDF